MIDAGMITIGLKGTSRFCSRPLATILALLGFLMFGVLPICIGAFARCGSTIAFAQLPLSPGPGVAYVAAYFILIPLALRFTLLRSWHARLGTGAMALLMFLLLLMASCRSRCCCTICSA